MIRNRKQVVIDKKFQYSISLKAVIIPLISMFIISTVLIYFSLKNNSNIEEININQAEIIDTFLALPQLMSPQNSMTQNANSKFKVNLGKSREIQRNNTFVIYFLIIMTIAQTIMIFTLSIFLTHKISGPVFVMMKYLREIKEGKKPAMRPLRKNDEFKEFYNEFCSTVDIIFEKLKNH